VTLSPGKARGIVPLSILMPGITSWPARISQDAVPSEACWRMVSSKRITPLMNSPIPAVVKRISRYSRRRGPLDSSPPPTKALLHCRRALVGGENALSRRGQRLRRLCHRRHIHRAPPSVLGLDNRRLAKGAERATDSDFLIRSFPNPTPET